MIELPRSTFYYRSTATSECLNDGRLIELIESIQDELPGYGYRRVTHELRRCGHVGNHKRVARVMRARGLGIKPRRRFVRTTDSSKPSINHALARGVGIDVHGVVYGEPSSMFQGNSAS
ncbi:IS3 family transposase [Variovorax sp. UC74_104]|uniref:IS3 family transposase n=1 Tax=Variovorax sp. UC74_104 TaxID=3374555 RepID=UPI003756DCCA